MAPESCRLPARRSTRNTLPPRCANWVLPTRLGTESSTAESDHLEAVRVTDDALPVLETWLIWLAHCEISRGLGSSEPRSAGLPLGGVL